MKAWTIIRIVGGVLAVICVPIVLLVVIWNMLIGVPPVPQVLQQLEADPAVTAVTGTPISLRPWGGSIHIDETNGIGSALLDTTAYGPQGTLHFEARMVKAGDWTITYLAIYPHGEAVLRIDPAHRASAGPEPELEKGPPGSRKTPTFSTAFGIIVVGSAVVSFLSLWVVLMLGLESIGPLASLRRRYPAPPESVPRLRFASIRLGLVSYNNCIRLGLSSDGLFLKLGFPFSLRPRVIRIPLNDLQVVEVKRSSFGSWVKCTVGAEHRGMTLPLRLFEESDVGRELLAKIR